MKTDEKTRKKCFLLFYLSIKKEITEVNRNKGDARERKRGESKMGEKR